MILLKKAMNREGEDRVTWMKLKSGSFSVKALYSVSVSVSLPEPGKLIPFPRCHLKSLGFV